MHFERVFILYRLHNNLGRQVYRVLLFVHALTADQRAITVLNHYREKFGGPCFKGLKFACENDRKGKGNFGRT